MPTVDDIEVVAQTAPMINNCLCAMVLGALFSVLLCLYRKLQYSDLFSYAAVPATAF